MIAAKTGACFLIWRFTVRSDRRGVEVGHRLGVALAFGL